MLHEANLGKCLLNEESWMEDKATKPLQTWQS